MTARASLLLLSGALVGPLQGCAHQGTPEAVLASQRIACPYEAAHDGTQSYELLCREPVANRVSVKHVLVGWKDLAEGHPTDPRAAARTHQEAQVLARTLLSQLQAGAAIEPLMKGTSEDPGSASSGAAYEASPGAALVSGFKSLSLRLEPGEAGIVESPFGLHVIQRVK